MICYYCLSFKEFNVQKSAVLHNISNSAEQNADGNGRLLLEAAMGLWGAQSLCERSW